MTTPASPPRNEPSPERPAARARNFWGWPVMWMVSLLIVVGGGVFVFKSCLNLPGETLKKTGQVAKVLGEQLAKVAAAFKNGTVTTTFTSYATSISGSQYLQFATLSQHEIFTRKDEATLAYGYIPLPDVVVEATAPVTYTYYLDLNERWDFRLEDGVVRVIAPDIRYNKPAVDASRIAYEIKKNSAIRDTKAAMENLKSSITWMSYRKAQTNVELVRETGRKQTEAFVENWMGKAFADGRKYPVKVVFRSEAQKGDGGLLPRKQDPPGK